jgi:hypothetical protein
MALASNCADTMRLVQGDGNGTVVGDAFRVVPGDGNAAAAGGWTAVGFAVEVEVVTNGLSVLDATG